MNQVFIVISLDFDEGIDIKGIYSTLELAKQNRKKREYIRLYNIDTYYDDHTDPEVIE